MSWADLITEEAGTLRAQNLGAAVCADGANGLRTISSIEARARGIYVELGQLEVPLVAYHPADSGSRMTWAPPGRDPIGLDAPENMTGPRILQMTGPGAGAYLSQTALVDGRYGERDERSEKLEISVEACTQLGIPNCARRGGAVDGLSITILPGSRRLTAEGGKVRPWSVRDAEEVSERADEWAKGWIKLTISVGSDGEK